MTLLLDEFDLVTFISLISIFKEFYNEMAVAEMLEIGSIKNMDVELDNYHEMLWKLGVDLRACAELGAISGNASTEEIEALSYIGSSIGYINRLNEEINDVINIDENLRTRLKNESIPLALIYASKQSDYNYKILKEIINKKEPNEKDIHEIIRICGESGAINYIKEDIRKTYFKVIKKFDLFPESHSKTMLIWVLYYIVNKNEILKKVEKLPV